MLTIRVDEERALRRLLGPLAWAVLADLALDAEHDGAGAWVVTTSARRVAAHLGVGKDTAARALRRLVSIGLLERSPQSAGPAGRFGTGSYELRVVPPMATGPCPSNEDTVRAGGVQAVDANSDTVTVSLLASPGTVEAGVGPRRRSRATGRAEAGQLSLLDASAGAVERGPKR